MKKEKIHTWPLSSWSRRWSPIARIRFTPQPFQLQIYLETKNIVIGVIIPVTSHNINVNWIATPLHD